MRSTLFSTILTCALVSLSSQIANAGPPSEGNKADVATDKARELHREGDALYAKGQYARARVAFLAAWALKKHPQIAGNLGDCELRLGMFRDAAEHLAIYLRASSSKPPAEAHRMYQEARAKVGAIVVKVDVEGADISVDGQVVGKSPLLDPVFVDPGHHTLVARLDAQMDRREIDIAPGAEQALLFARLGSRPQEVRSGPGDAPEKSWAPGAGWILTSGVLAASGIGAGIALSLAARDKQSQIDALSSGTPTSCSSASSAGSARCTSLHDAVSSKSTLNNAAVSSFLVGGTLALATAGLWIWAESSKRPQAVLATPVVGTDYTGFALHGAW